MNVLSFALVSELGNLISMGYQSDCQIPGRLCGFTYFWLQGGTQERIGEGTAQTIKETVMTNTSSTCQQLGTLQAEYTETTHHHAIYPELLFQIREVSDSNSSDVWLYGPV